MVSGEAGEGTQKKGGSFFLFLKRREQKVWPRSVPKGEGERREGKAMPLIG